MCTQSLKIKIKINIKEMAMCWVSFPSKSLKKERGLKGFDVGVSHGLYVNGISTVASRHGNSCSIIFLIVSA